MNAKEAQEIVNSFPPEFNSFALPNNFYEAKGYLQGRKDLIAEMEPVREALEGYFGNGHDVTDSDTHQENQCRQCKLEKALALYDRLKGEA